MVVHRKCFSLFFSMTYILSSFLLTSSLSQPFRYTSRRLKTAMQASPSLKPQVLVLAGATSVGKSAVSMELCKHLDAEIVIADSVQVYKGLNIGANKPTVEDQEAVPHHLIDICDPSHQMNTAEFCDKALEAINDIIGRNKKAIVVGGSTMWIQWLVHGKPDAPKASESAIHKAKELLDHFEAEKNWEEGLNSLRLLDVDRAAKLPKNDWYRLRRYLEIAIDLSEGRSGAFSDEEEGVPNARKLTGSRKSFLANFDVRCFFMMEARENLYHTIDQRCEQMLQGGLFEEVYRLISTGKLHPSFPISRSIGYRQVIDYFCRRVNDGDSSSFEQFLREFATATRNYAKKQCNWYRKDEKFLFLKMDRNLNTTESQDTIGHKRKAPSTLNPYEQCGAEISYWLSQSEEEFENALNKQIRIASIFNQHLSTGTVNVNQEVKNEDEFQVIRFLIDHNAIQAVPKIPQKDKKELLKSWIQSSSFSNKGNSKGHGEDDRCLTALEIDVRAGELGDRQQSMKTFNSRLLRGDKSRFDAYIKDADTYRKNLWNDCPSLMESFASSFCK